MRLDVDGRQPFRAMTCRQSYNAFGSKVHMYTRTDPGCQDLGSISKLLDAQSFTW